jgi:alkanesulfonate monooxygenase SsuD/methylene tetrahydromethanopterin reductase-like flavin-dependent oxidoreductase (luciferase family)
MKADLGIALRSTVFPPNLILPLIPELDTLFSSIWFPAVSARLDPLDLCALSLGATSRVNVATGVIRLPENDLTHLASRADTLSQASGNRFILGVGTGSLRGRTAVDQLVDLTKRLRASYSSATPVPVYFAALGPMMVRAAFENADGVLLNFCSPRYASSMTSREASKKREGFRVACYVKLFFAEDESEATRMMVDEFIHYDSLPQYHKMFEAMGVSGTIETFRNTKETSEHHITEEIAEISMDNPTQKEVLELLERFSEAGVDTPIIYPYVAGDDSYKLQLVRTLCGWLKQ